MGQGVGEKVCVVSSAECIILIEKFSWVYYSDLTFPEMGRTE